MPLITTGKSFIRALEKNGALGLYMPLEGGAEGRYQRRLRAYGYQTINITARGLGDLAAYLTRVHGVRPPHLGKKTIGRDACVGDIYFVPPIATYELGTLPANAKGLALWIIEGQILSSQEIQYLVDLTKEEPKIKVVLELGGDRYVNWKPLADTLAAA
ncbi:MAG: NAD(P)H-quinone oxidoreductase subunit N [Pleurocapsa sp. MO_192.B19]|nr:NAD(P)H-quinone oxidoreductase subunit N [Pleurocapsa sp. MO_192.B19]